jgi:hypothetical protein
MMAKQFWFKAYGTYKDGAKHSFIVRGNGSIVIDAIRPTKNPDGTPGPATLTSHQCGPRVKTESDALHEIALVFGVTNVQKEIK